MQLTNSRTWAKIHKNQGGERTALAIRNCGLKVFYFVRQKYKEKADLISKEQAVVK